MRNPLGGDTYASTWRHLMRSCGLLLGLGLLLAGCGDDGFTPPDCAQGVELSVGGGPTPEFTWTPACRAAGLSVTTLDRFEVVTWLVTTPDLSNRLEAPLRYGTLPVAATQEGALVPLETDHTYQAVLLFAEPVQGGVTALSGAGPVQFSR
jgi:hypothetical protein